MSRDAGDRCTRGWPTRWAILAFVCWLAIVSTHASGQATRPAAASMYDGQPIRRAAPEASATQPSMQASEPSPRRSSSGFVDMQRVAIALALVLALVFILRGLGRKFFPNVTGGRSGGVVRVLARSPVAPRQQVLLLQIGRRVLVVADNGTQLSALSEIRDADEIAQLAGQLAGTGRAEKEAFAAAFDEAQRDFLPPPATSEPESPEPRDPAIAETQGEIAGLVEKVRVLTRQLGR